MGIEVFSLRLAGGKVRRGTFNFVCYFSLNAASLVHSIHQPFCSTFHASNDCTDSLVPQYPESVIGA
jgi:hypothetical protein